MSSAFAQPSGICISDETNAMFIADSESSSIRAIELGSGKVKAVVGGARDPHVCVIYHPLSYFSMM